MSTDNRNGVDYITYNASKGTPIVLTIPRTPPSYSQIIRMKVKDRIHMKILWRNEVMVAMRTFVGPNAFQGTFTDYKKGFKNVYIFQYRKALIRDKENLWASVKPILDALKHNHLIIDDDMKNIDLVEVRQKRATGESMVKTEIIISDPI